MTLTCGPSRDAHIRLGVSALTAAGPLVPLPGVVHASVVPVPLRTADPFVVLAGSEITTSGATTLNGAKACHVFWQVTSWATIVAPSPPVAPRRRRAPEQVRAGSPADPGDRGGLASHGARAESRRDDAGPAERLPGGLVHRRADSW